MIDRPQDMGPKRVAPKSRPATMGDIHDFFAKKPKLYDDKDDASRCSTDYGDRVSAKSFLDSSRASTPSSGKPAPAPTGGPDDETVPGNPEVLEDTVVEDTLPPSKARASLLVSTPPEPCADARDRNINLIQKQRANDGEPSLYAWSYQALFFTGGASLPIPRVSDNDYSWTIWSLGKSWQPRRGPELSIDRSETHPLRQQGDACAPKATPRQQA